MAGRIYVSQYFSQAPVVHVFAVAGASDPTAPVVSGVASSGITTTSATIGFTTSEPAYHQVEYGPTPAYGTMTALDSTLRTSHSQGLTGLTAGRLYHYRARATDAAGNTGMSGDFTFTTGSSVALPTATLTATPPSIAAGAASTLTWSTTGATTIAINQGIGTVAATGTRSVSPTTSTSYTLTATNAAGSVTATAGVAVGAAQTVSVPNVVGLTQTAATNAMTAPGLTVGTVTTASSATVAVGSVISASPAAGTPVAVGSAVNLVVSSGPVSGSPVPVAAYAFNEGAGTTTGDASGNGRTGTLTNATWTAAGKYGGALSFNGSSSRVTVADAAPLHLSTAMTLEAWVNPSGTGSAELAGDHLQRRRQLLSGDVPGTPSAPTAGGTIGGGLVQVTSAERAAGAIRGRMSRPPMTERWCGCS